MTTDLVLQPKEHIEVGKKALHELKILVKHHPDKLVIQGKQYLFFSDWQILGAFFGISARVTGVIPITEKKKFSEDSENTFIEVVGYQASADAVRNGEVISSAIAMCTKDEDNWKKKPNFQLMSMAQTRACAKSLRNCLQWVVRLPESTFADESVEEQHQGSF